MFHDDTVKFEVEKALERRNGIDRRIVYLIALNQVSAAIALLETKRERILDKLLDLDRSLTADEIGDSMIEWGEMCDTLLDLNSLG